MGRNEETKSRGLGRLRQAANAVRRAFSRGRRSEETAEPVSVASAAQPQRGQKTAVKSRPAKREADIPLDVLDRTYIPPATSSKASFRSDGADHQQDQEFSRGVADADWNDEDHFTNKSGDPRIGTRGRTYEANESRDEQR
jgi:hypothetical protein